jgi:hypothetical protein
MMSIVIIDVNTQESRSSANHSNCPNSGAARCGSGLGHEAPEAGVLQIVMSPLFGALPTSQVLRGMKDEDIERFVPMVNEAFEVNAELEPGGQP